MKILKSKTCEDGQKIAEIHEAFDLNQGEVCSFGLTKTVISSTFTSLSKAYFELRLDKHEFGQKKSV